MNFFILNILILKIKKYYFYLLKWLHRVKETADKVGREMVKDEIMEFCGKCPDLKIRHHFGRKAVKGALFIAEIREETVDFTTVSYQAAMEVHFARIQRCWDLQCWF